MRVSALKSTRARFCIAIALAHAAAACSGGEGPRPDAAIETIAFAPGQGAVHGFVDAMHLDGESALVVDYKSNLLGDQSPTLATRKREGASMAGFPGGEGSDAMRQRFLEGTR